MEGESSWLKLYLSNNDEQIFLGAATQKYVIEKLLNCLESSNHKSAGKINGVEVFWVMSLSEKHFVLYCAKSDNSFNFYWQNSRKESFKVAAETSLTFDEAKTWAEKLRFI
ncbi:MAG TPA: hypothetical protein PKY59_27025 [Pyrinomonadaceae bacterium]|nr:hypothetical protein [Pyrinomonadaceae bacterium]